MKTRDFSMRHENPGPTCRWRGKKAIVAAMIVTFLGLGGVGTAHSFTTFLGEDARLDWDTTLTYELSMRVKDQNNTLLANPNGDDGNRSFDKGDLFKNRTKISSEADLQYKNMGLFVRGRAWKDFAYSGSNEHDSPLTNNNGAMYGGPLKDNDDWSNKIEDEYETKAEFLDYFAYGDWDLGGHFLTVRVGSQVVSWGESLFIANGISSAQSPVDIRETNNPSVELKDVFLPVEQVYAQIELFGGFSLAGFYQWEWDQLQLDEAGTYFGTGDMIDKNGHRILVAPGLPVTIDRVSDDYAKDSGQWGASLRYLADWLNDTEFSLSFINYHDKGPQVIVNPFGGTASVDWATFGPAIGLDPQTTGMFAFLDTNSYFLRYAEDIKLYGFSFGTAIGDTNVSGEVSYRDGAPVEAFGAIPGTTTYVEADITQVQVSFVHNLGPRFLWDSAILLGEIGYNKAYGIGGADLTTDESAWGYVVKITPYYLNIFDGLDLDVPVTWKQNPNGVSPVVGTFSEDANSLAIGLDFTYLNDWRFGVSYVDFMGDAEDNSKTDRDYVSAYLKYTF